MKLTTYLNYGGNCEQAFRFYQQHLGGNITAMMTFAGQPLPDGAPPGWEKAIMYARIEHCRDGADGERCSAGALQAHAQRLFGTGRYEHG